MVRSFLNLFLPEDEYKRLRVLYFMSEATFLMASFMMLASALNNYWLHWGIGADELTFILVIAAMLMVGYTYFRYILSGIEYTEASDKQGYKKERRTAVKRSITLGVVVFIIFLISKGIPTNFDEGIDIVVLPVIFTIFYFLFDLVSLKRSVKKNKDLDD